MAWLIFFFLINIKFSVQCIPDHYQQAHVDKFLYMNQSLMHLIDNGNQNAYMYWLIENFLCSFLNYPLIEFLQSNMIQFVACSLQYCMIMYSTDILRKLQCIYNAYRKYCSWKNCNFFVFIRIIKIIHVHVGLGCHLGFNFVHQFCLQKKNRPL